MGQVTRRAVLTTGLAVALGGCLDSLTDGDDDSADEPSDGGENASADGSSNTTGKSDDEEMDSDEEPIPEEERQELVDQLPEPSPLVSALFDIVAAADRDAAAADHGFEFREADHSVRVMIRLEPEAELSKNYRIDTVDEHNGYVTAYVYVDDLVPLAMADEVRKIQRPAESRRHDEESLD